MFAKTKARPDTWRTAAFITVLAIIVLIFGASLANASPNAPAETPLSTFTFTLEPGDSVSPTFFNAGNTNINFSFAITGVPSASASLAVFNASNSNIWSGSAGGGEILWGNTTLTNGNNTFTITNTGAASLTITLKLFRIPALQAPTPTYSWLGQAAPAGLNSEIKLNFPTSGLYTFDFSVSSNGRYEFLLGTNNIQRTVTADDTVTLYVAAGVQTMKIVQDTAASAVVNWQVDIAYSGAAANTLPYAQSNNAIAEEWLTLNLAAAAQVNMVITATGATNDQLTVTLNNAEPQAAAANEAIISVIAGETTWTTFNLPAGATSIHLQSNGDVMDYDFEIMTLPAADYAYSGSADAAGQNSKIRMTFNTAGLYNFDFGSNGRYQFLLNIAGASYIQKTVENSSSVTYYVPAGTHDLIIEQDTAANAVWDVDISFNAAGSNSLPYAKTGGELGGAGNDFTTEWLPISLSAAATVNMAIDAAGRPGDKFAIEVYQHGGATPAYTLTQVLGTEEQWTNFNLSAGQNRLKLIANSSNANKLSYSLNIANIPTNGTLNWDGRVLAAGLNPGVKVNFPTTGLYQFNIESAAGFANLVLDDNMVNQLASPLASPPDLKNSYHIQVSAGVHEIFVVQDASYANTTWTASVAPAAAGAKFFEFTGTLANGESVAPIYPGSMAFNFSLEVSGNDVALAITNGGGGAVWSGAALDGETLWGTGALSGNNELLLTNASGGSADVKLTLYHIPDAGTTWDGFADGAGLNSQIRVNFPSDGLYTFDLNADNGRYQFLVESDFIQKTVAASGTDPVAYFVPAGMHLLKIDQDTTGGADWDLTISNVGAAHDALPYSKAGGEIGGAGNDFGAEWLPLNLSAATAVNIAAAITGTAGDSVVMNVRSASNTILDSLTVNTGETTWTTVDLPAGTSRLEFVADGGNTNAAAYAVTVAAIPTAANTDWDGNAMAAGENSQIRVSFPQSGLYTFTYGVDSGNGRYQFLVNDEFVQKTVEANGAVTYFVPQGTHTLTLVQDTTTGADWSLVLSGPGAANDSLPYAKMGGEIGGSGNNFTQEWLPVHVGADTAVNTLVTLDGSTADSVVLEIWDAVTRTETINAVHGTESVWAAFTLPANGRIHMLAQGNSAPISYEVEIIAIPSPSFSWQGTSLAGTLNSTIEMNMQVGGFYRIQGDYPQGFASLIIDPPAVNGRGVQSDLDMTVELTAGMHTFVTLQGDSFPTSTFIYTVTLLSAYAPEITSVTPAQVVSGQQTTITIDGANFLDGAVVKLIGANNYTLVTTYVSGSQLTAVVPAAVNLGMYTVEVTNPDDQSATLTDGLEVVRFYLYLPLVVKNN